MKGGWKPGAAKGPAQEPLQVSPAPPQFNPNPVPSGELFWEPVRGAETPTNRFDKYPPLMGDDNDDHVDPSGEKGDDVNDDDGW